MGMVTMNRLHPRIQIVWSVRAVVFAIIVGIVGGVAIRFTVLPPWVAGGATVAILALGLTFAVARYRRWSYEIREDALYLERGVLTQVRMVVPFVRIQHVDSRQNPVERLTGLASTVVYTAGSRGADVRIPGLTDGEARELRERLKQLSIATDAGEDDAV
jgi:membrane protein YdbS with pleckstrin-like domain